MTTPKTRRTPRDAGPGEPTAGSPGPDTWPFTGPTEQRERIVPEPVSEGDGREGGRVDPTGDRVR